MSTATAVTISGLVALVISGGGLLYRHETDDRPKADQSRIAPPPVFPTAYPVVVPPASCPAPEPAAVIAPAPAPVLAPTRVARAHARKTSKTVTKLKSKWST
jgi:hypothetical protein